MEKNVIDTMLMNLVHGEKLGTKHQFYRNLMQVLWIRTLLMFRSLQKNFVVRIFLHAK